MKRRSVILCIDDEETILESLSMELEGCFPEVEVELLQHQEETEATLAALMEAGVEIPVVVCDYIMPGRRGDQVLAEIHRRLPRTRTVMLTGQSSLEGVTNAINNANLYRYVAKPWVKEDLALTLAGALESYGQEMTIQEQNQQLRELNQGLELKVQARTRALTAANAELTDANQKIREYLDIIDRHVLISRIDRSGTVVYASEALCRTTGYSSHHLLGVNYWHALYSSTTESQMREIRACIEGGKTWEGEILHQRRDGSYYWAYEIISPDKGEEPVIIGFTSIRQDITDRKAVEAISITDSLTGLYNRRHFDQVLGQELRRAQRNGQRLAFALLDVDHFKAYNDRYGHAAGDAVLQQLGRLISGHFKRSSDFCFRIGGEEFALLFPVQSRDEAARISTSLVEAVENLHIEHRASDASPHLTISIGVSVLSLEGEAPSPESVYQAADTLLYDAKKAGRNRCEIRP